MNMSANSKNVHQIPDISKSGRALQSTMRSMMPARPPTQSIASNVTMSTPLISQPKFAPPQMNLTA